MQSNNFRLTFVQIPPGKVLVIGAGVAGLSAIATASYQEVLRHFQ